MLAQSQINPGQTFGDYRVDQVLGQNAFGVRASATQQQTGRKVFLRVFPPGVSQDLSFVDRFPSEARALSIIRHAALPEVIDLGVEKDGSAFLVTELLSGESLQKRIGKLGSLGQPETLRIGGLLAQALNQCHQEGVSCSILAPERVVFAGKGATGEGLKILDVGVAKLVGVPSLPPSPYAAPEQGRAPLSLKADVYALGVMLEEMLTGAAKGAGGGIEDDPMIDENLVAVIQRMQIPDPAERPSMGEVVEELGLLKGDQGAAAPSGGGGLARAVTKALAIVKLGPSSSPDMKKSEGGATAPRATPGKATQAWAQIVVEKRQKERQKAKQADRRGGVTGRRLAVALTAIGIVGFLGLVGMMVGKKMKREDSVQTPRAVPAEVKQEQVDEKKEEAQKAAQQIEKGTERAPAKNLRKSGKRQRKPKR